MGVPSKKIYLKRNRPFVHEQIVSEEAHEALAHSKRSVGSYWASRNSTKKGTGLSDTELLILLPRVISSVPADVDFRKNVDLFYTEIDTNVPYRTGIELEIALMNEQEDIEDVFKGKSKVTAENLPVNLDDYIKFRHALKHPDVVWSPELAKGNQLAVFYFEDPEKVSKGKLASIDTADKAMQDYQRAKDDPDQVEMLVTLMRHYIPKQKGKPAVILSNLKKDDRVLVLRELAVAQPEKFSEFANDANLAKKYLVDEFLTIGLLKRVGNTIMINESGESIGDTLKQAADYMFAPKQTQLLNQFKAEYKETRIKKEAVN